MKVLVNWSTFIYSNGQLKGIFIKYVLSSYEFKQVWGGGFGIVPLI